MGTSEKKKQRADLSGVVIHVARSLSFRSRLLKVWTTKIDFLGGRIVEDPADPEVTHVVADPEKLDRLPPQLQPGGRQGSEKTTPFLLTSEWVSGCIAEQRRLPERSFIIAFPTPTDLSGKVPGGGQSTAEDSTACKTGKYETWLGHWAPEYDAMDNSELMLQARFSIPRSTALGNEGIVIALRQLEKFETAVGENHGKNYESKTGVKEKIQAIQSPKSRNNYAPPSTALPYARAAAAVRGCTVKLGITAAGALNCALPFVSGSIMAQIVEIIRTGTCSQLEQFRSNVAVRRQSNGMSRPGTEGGAVKAMFIRLPGCGPRMAFDWYDWGCRSFEDVEAACRPGSSDSSRFNITNEVRFSLSNREGLLGSPTDAELEEMIAATMAALMVVDGPGWEVIKVGGAQRGQAGHDADFIVTHSQPGRASAGWVTLVIPELVKKRHLMDFGMWLRVQEGCMKRSRASILSRAEYLDKKGRSSKHNLSDDKFDHIFGVFRSSQGVMRRMDLIFVPKEQFAFGYLGWVGSRAYLRFLRTVVGARDMKLNSHRLTATKNGKEYLVPEEGPPLDRHKNAVWPPGWNENRQVVKESDILELLGVPYRVPSDRNCG